MAEYSLDEIAEVLSEMLTRHGWEKHVKNTWIKKPKGFDATHYLMQDWGSVMYLTLEPNGLRYEYGPDSRPSGSIQEIMGVRRFPLEHPNTMQRIEELAKRPCPEPKPVI